MKNNPVKIILRSILCIAVAVGILVFWRAHLGVVIVLFVLIAVCMSAIVWASYQRKSYSAQQEEPKYAVKSALVSQAEHHFFELLTKAANKYSVMQQVPLSSVIDKVTHNAFRTELFRTIDYCLVDKDTYAPKLLIELNDASHNRLDRIDRDGKVATICSRAGIPIIAFETKDTHTVRSIRKSIKDAFRNKA